MVLLVVLAVVFEVTLMAIGRPQRYYGFCSRPLQLSKYCNKVSHRGNFLFSSVYKSSVYTIL